MSEPTSPLGLIAGSRDLPLVLAREARRQGVERIVAVGFTGETDPALEPLVDELHWIRVGQLAKMIKAFTGSGVKRCVMAGQVAPSNLYNFRPDLRAMGVLVRLRERNAHTIFGAIADELAKDGVTLISAVPWLRPVMPGAGYRIGPAPSDIERADLVFGARIAKEVSRLEIGQSVVVKEGTTLAVEGFEGTDQCLARGGQLAGKSGGAVAVKVARDNHDMRFDIPTIGPRTLKVCADSGIRVLAFEPGRTLLLDEAEARDFANKRKITVLALPDQAVG